MDYRLRPSAAAVWSVCHGMPALSAGMPDIAEEDETVVREEGTACHWLAYHTAIDAGQVALGFTAPNGIEVDEEMMEAVDMYLGVIRAWNCIEVSFEQQLHCAMIHEECGGTADVIAFDAEKRIIYIGDLKYGYRPVEVLNNKQLLCYLAGALAFFGVTLADVEVVFMICQPRAYHRDGPVRFHRAPGSAFFPGIFALSQAALLALGPNPQCKINPGCRNCDGRARCETLQTAALDVMDSCHSATPHDLPFRAAEDELRRLAWAKDIVSARITALEQQVLHGMRRDGQVSRHYALEQKAGRTVWNEGSRQVLENVAKLMKVNITNEPKLITPTQALKKLPPAVVAKYSSRPISAFKLVPADAHLMRRIFGNK